MSIKELWEFRLTVLAAELLGWDDDLSRRNILGIWQWVVEQANGSDDLTSWLEHGLRSVTWVANHDWGFGALRAALDSSGQAVLHGDLVDRSVEHVSATVDGAKSTESLG